MKYPRLTVGVTTPIRHSFFRTISLTPEGLGLRLCFDRAFFIAELHCRSSLPFFTAVLRGPDLLAMSHPDSLLPPPEAAADLAVLSRGFPRSASVQ